MTLKLKSKTFPQSARLPFGEAQFEIIDDTASHFDDSYDDLFQVDADTTSVWTETTNSNITKYTSPFQVQTSTTLSSSYELTSQYRFDSNEYYEFVAGFKWAPEELILSDANVYAVYITNGVEEIYLTFRINDVTGNTFQVELTDGSTWSADTFTYSFTGSASLLKFGYYPDGSISVWINDQNSWRFLRNWDFAMGNSMDILVKTQTTGFGGTVTYLPFYYLPVCSGYRNFSDDEKFWTYSKKTDSAFFRTNSGAPGEYTLTVYGTGVSTGTSETVSVTVQNERFTESSFEFMVSDVELFYDDISDNLVCPVFGDPETTNRSNLILNNTCFNDGSAQNADPIDVKIAKSGNLGPDRGRRKMPRFSYDDGTDVYGYDMRFERIHQPDANAEVGSTRTIRSLRYIPLSDGKRFYYGTTQDQMNSTQEVRIEWNTGSATDVNVLKEDGTNVGTFNTSTDGPQWDFRLFPGRYYITGTKDANLSNEVAVYLHPSTDNTKIARLEQDLYSTAGTWRLYFEVKEFESHLYYGVFDPSAGSTTWNEEASADVSARTDSISAIEIDDDTVVIFYEEASDVSLNDVIDFRGREITYQVYTISTDTLSSKRYLYLPRFGNLQSWLDAFDIFTDGQDLYIVCNYETNNSKFYHALGATGQSVRLDRYWSPYLQFGFYIIKTPLYKYSFNKTHTEIVDYDLIEVPLESLKEVGIANFPKSQPSGTYSGEEYYPAAGCFFRANYDSEEDKAVISLIDQQSRLPFVFVGKGAQWEEIGVPYFFNYYFETISSGVATDKIDACYGPDGFIYAVASTRGKSVNAVAIDEFMDVVQFGIIDPDILESDRAIWARRKFLSEIGGGSYFTNANWVSIDLYEPEFGFIPVRILTPHNLTSTITYEENDGGWITTATIDEVDFRNNVFPSIGRDKNYMIFCQAGGINLDFPLIYQMGEPDVIPFITSTEGMYTPEYYSNSDYTVSNATDSTTYTRLQNLNATNSKISKSLDRTTVTQDKHIQLANGYIVHARLKVTPDVGNDMTEPCYLNIDAVGGIVLGQDESPPVPFQRSQVRARILGETIHVDYYDYDATSWTNIDTITVTPGVVLDCYLAVQLQGRKMTVSTYDDNSFGDKVRVSFWVKENDYVSSLESGSGDELQYMINDNVQIVYEDTIKIKTDYTTEESIFDIGFLPNGVIDRSEYVDIYEFGWGLIRPHQEFYASVDDTKAGTPYIDYNIKETPGKRWIEYNDTQLFYHKPGTPDNFFPVYRVNETGRSFSHYWPNGFNWFFSGDSGFINDTWTIQRKAINTTDVLLSKELHGAWRSTQDNSSIKIWADAQDSGLQKFDVDALMLLGQNFPYVTIIARDDSADPWSEIETVYFDYFKMDGITYTQDSTELIVKTGADFSEGTFAENDWYFTSDTYAKTSKIHSNINGKLYCDDTGSAASATEGQVFTSKFVHKLDTAIRYRYVGIEIPSVNTYEGYYKLHTLDFGKMTSIPLESLFDTGSGMNLEVSTNVQYLVEDAAIPLAFQKPSRLFSMNFSLMDIISYWKFMSLINKTSLNKKPVWIAENIDHDSSKVWLTLIWGEPVENVEIDEDDEKYHRLTFEFRSVE